MTMGSPAWMAWLRGWAWGIAPCGPAATIVGKPSAYSYRTVLADAGYAPEEAIMVSDESDPDLVGAREAGLATLLFRDSSQLDDLHDAGTQMARSYDEIWERVTANPALTS